MMWPFKKNEKPSTRQAYQRKVIQGQLLKEQRLQRDMEQAIHRVGRCLKEDSPAAAYQAVVSGGFSRGVTQKMADAAARQKEGDAYGATGNLQEAGEMAINEYRASVLRARGLRKELEEM